MTHTRFVILITLQPLEEGLDSPDKDYVQHSIPGRQAVKPPGGGGYGMRRAKRKAPDVS